MNRIGYLAAIAAGSIVGLANEGYAQDSPVEDKTVQSEGRLESRLVDVDSKLRYDVFDRIYDSKVIGEYEKIGEDALAEEYGADYLKSLSKAGKMRGFAVGFGEALEDAFDNPDKVIDAMDEADKKLYDDFDASETLKKQDRDPRFRDMIGVTSDYKFSPERESDKLAAFVVQYVSDDIETMATVSVNLATSLGRLAGDEDRKLISYKIDVNSPRFKRAADFMTSIRKKK